MAKYHGKTDVKKKHYNLGAALDEKRKIEILKEAFERRVGYPLDLEDPQTMNAKIMWMKLYYQDPLITQCADKFAVKDYVMQTVGAEYTVPTIASWSDPDDIDFDALPDQFVLKVNWSSGYNIIVKDKSQLDQENTRAQLRRWIQPDRNAYYQYFNWGFKHMKPVIYAEEYLEQIAGQVYDYKFFMCDGKYEFMLIATDRANDDDLTHDFFDNKFNRIDLTYGELKSANTVPQKPKNYDKMVELAEKLSAPFPFVRVDFYEVGNRVYLGEMTFYPAGGLKPFHPAEWDYTFGSKINLPEKKILDKEDALFKFRSFLKRTQLKSAKALGRARRKLVRKLTVKGKKYVSILGLRIPYSTHIERTPTCRKKYVSMLGLQIHYKKLPLLDSPLNTNTVFRYAPNDPLRAFMMEDKITPEIQRIHCEQKAYKQLGYFPNLKNPRTLNEKIIWLALNYKNPDIVTGADKGTAKDWITGRVGPGYVVPLLGVYDDVNDIDFANLPQRFVAKLNDGWGADKVMIVRDKNKLNIDRTKAVLSSWLYPWNNYYYQNMCITDEKMPKPTIVIEEYLDAGKASLDDFKFYCCNGEPKFALVVSGRGGTKQTRSFVDMDWVVLPFARKGMKIAEEVMEPENLDLMKSLCRKLSAGFPFVRIDFYEVDGRVYVGEMTFTPGMFLSFTSKTWDNKLGEYLRLPIETDDTDSVQDDDTAMDEADDTDAVEIIDPEGEEKFEDDCEELT